MNFEAVTCQLW